MRKSWSFDFAEIFTMQLGILFSNIRNLILVQLCEFFVRKNFICIDKTFELKVPKRIK